MKKYLQIKYIEIVKVSKSLSRNYLSVISLGVILGTLIYFETIFIGVLIWFCYVCSKPKYLGLLILLSTFSFFYSQNYVSKRELESEASIETEVIFQAIEAGSLNEFDQTVIMSVQGFDSHALVKLPKYPQIHTNEKIIAAIKLEPIPEDYSKSYKSYLKSKNIFLYTKIDSEYEVIQANLFYRTINSLQQLFESKVYKYFHEPNSSLLAGITLGFDSDYSQSYKESLQHSGLSHIAAVSGFNFLVIFSVLLKLSKSLGRRKVLLISFLFLFFYLLLVGTTNISALRAGIMIIGIIFASLLGKPNINLTSLLFTASAMLLFSPLLITNISFQLSFAATIGIISFSKNFSVTLKKILGEFLGEISAVTLSAYFVTSPIIIFSFGSQGFLAILANILVGEFVGIVTVLGFVFLATSLFDIEVLSVLTARATESFLFLINRIIYNLNTTPSFKIENEYVSLIIIIMLFVLLDYFSTLKRYA